MLYPNNEPSLLFVNCMKEVKMMYKLHVLISAPRVINIILSLNRIYMYTYRHIYAQKNYFILKFFLVVFHTRNFVILCIFVKILLCKTSKNFIYIKSLTQKYTILFIIRINILDDKSSQICVQTLFKHFFYKRYSYPIQNGSTTT